MITGAHLLLYSRDPDADRAFFRDTLGFRAVDAGGGWLIFGLPAAEAALHPADDVSAPTPEGQLLPAALYLMCEDLVASLVELDARQVPYGKVLDAPWGSVTTLRLPSGGQIGLYQPRHPTALDLPRGS